MFNWIFKNGSRVQFKDDAKPMPTGMNLANIEAIKRIEALDIVKVDGLNTYDDKTTIIKREEVIEMPIAKERNVRYTGTFSFEVPAGDPRDAAEKLDALRALADVKNVRSVNVKVNTISTGV